jgi:hypothetical protein
MEGKENDWKEEFYFFLYVYDKVVRGHTGSTWNYENGERAFLRNVFAH